MWQEGEQQKQYGSQAQYYSSPSSSSQMQSQQTPLQFYAADSGYYPSSRPSLDGAIDASSNSGFGGNIQNLSWWSAFGTGGIDGEPPLLEELGINFSHIRAKSLTVLNPWKKIDEHIMDDADLAGPALFYFCFGTFLLFSGKPHFGYIYGVALLGCISIYTLLNLMSEKGVDAYRTASVLGYCLLPMVGVGALSVMVVLDGAIGYLLSIMSVLWCTYSASGIFVAVLKMSDQRLLVAYPVGLLYGCFAMLSVFSVGSSATIKVK